MNHQDMTLEDLAIVRQSMREALVEVAQKMEHPLSDEEADHLYLEADALMIFPTAPITVMHVAHALLAYRIAQNAEGLNWFQSQISQCQNWQQAEAVIASIWA